MSEHPQDLLGPYSIEALDDDEQRQVSEHLAGCPVCREELSELDALRLQLDQIPPEAFLDGPRKGAICCWPARSVRPGPKTAGPECGPSPPLWWSCWPPSAAAC